MGVRVVVGVSLLTLVAAATAVPAFAAPAALPSANMEAVVKAAQIDPVRPDTR